MDKTWIEPAMIGFGVIALVLLLVRRGGSTRIIAQTSGGSPIAANPSVGMFSPILPNRSTLGLTPRPVAGPTTSTCGACQNLSQLTTHVSNGLINNLTSTGWVDQVKQMYATFGRQAPDAEGVQYWTSELAEGMSSGQVYRNILQSAATFQNSTDSTFAGYGRSAADLLSHM